MASTITESTQRIMMVLTGARGKVVQLHVSLLDRPFFFCKDHSDKLSELNASDALNSACVKTVYGSLP